ncbi:MAG: DNA alkylation repair protein, partial [Chitinophagaceae bacterium]
MTLTATAEDILTQLRSNNTKLGDVRKIANEIKKDHDLAMQLWAAGELLPRLLAILIMDKKHLSQEFIDRLD